MAKCALQRATRVFYTKKSKKRMLGFDVSANDEKMQIFAKTRFYSAEEYI